MNLIFFALLLIIPQNGNVDLRKSALKSTTPSDEIVRLDINHDGKPDILERWWNGKRVRWLDENGDPVRAEHLRTAYYNWLALQSAASRRRNRDGRVTAARAGIAS